MSFLPRQLVLVTYDSPAKVVYIASVALQGAGVINGYKVKSAMIKIDVVKASVLNNSILVRPW